MIIVNVLMLMAATFVIGYYLGKGKIEVTRRASKEEVKQMWAEIEEKKQEYDNAIDEMNKQLGNLYDNAGDE